ncbi:MAG: hypothetical protein M1453_00560 [Acidobacteria bacterium]|nr:hypothetical protein [Acidobacteriota bacterium]MCL5286477.1 hypothetical protein [Acidobacteriota bacterium]
MLDLARNFPVAVWLMALGFVMAIAVAGWRLVRLLRSPEPRAAAPQGAARIPLLKPAVLIVVGILLFVGGVYVDGGGIDLLTLLGEFVLLMGVMLLVHRLESGN